MEIISNPRCAFNSNEILQEPLEPGPDDMVLPLGFLTFKQDSNTKDQYRKFPSVNDNKSTIWWFE
jgi:hypothetical protein